MTFIEVSGADAANFVRSCRGGGLTELWHRRLRQLIARNVYALQSMIKGMKLGKSSHPTFKLVYKTCIGSKQYAVTLFDDLDKQTTKSLEFVHSDICDPMRNMSMERGMCFITFVDVFLMMLWVYILKSMIYYFQRFKEFQTVVEKHLEHKIKAFR